MTRRHTHNLQTAPKKCTLISGNKCTQKQAALLLTALLTLGACGNNEDTAGDIEACEALASARANSIQAVNTVNNTTTTTERQAAQEDMLTAFAIEKGTITYALNNATDTELRGHLETANQWKDALGTTNEDALMAYLYAYGRIETQCTTLGADMG